MSKQYTVYVNDNARYMDESARYKLGEFADCESAIAACKRIVDEFLDRPGPNSTAEELFN